MSAETPKLKELLAELMQPVDHIPDIPADGSMSGDVWLQRFMHQLHYGQSIHLINVQDKIPFVMLEEVISAAERASNG